MLLKKFEDCIFVHGHKSSLIVDLGRRYFLQVEKKVLTEIESKLNITYKSGNNFIDFLIESDVLFLISEEDKNNFIPLNKRWVEPSIIDNAIIKCSPNLYESVFNVLEELLCYNVTIIAAKEEIKDLSAFLTFLSKNIKYKIFQNVNIYLEETYHTKMKNNIAQFMNETPNVQQLFFIKNKKTFEICKSYMDHRQAMASTSEIISTKNRIFFNPTIYFYLDSLFFNTSSNKRLFIDKKGELKNNEYDSEIYGNIVNLSSDEVKAIIQSRYFQKKWKISKDKVEICKDCEYRYICEDLTPIVRGADQKWYRAEKCDYDPYLSSWNSIKE